LEVNLRVMRSGRVVMAVDWARYAREMADFSEWCEHGGLQRLVLGDMWMWGAREWDGFTFHVRELLPDMQRYMRVVQFVPTDDQAHRAGLQFPGPHNAEFADHPWGINLYHNHNMAVLEEYADVDMDELSSEEYAMIQAEIEERMLH